MKVLFLSAWYPTERDPMAGLFVEKHAEAVRRLGADVRVIYNEEKGLKWWLRMRRDLHALWYEGWRPDLTQVNVNGKNALVALYLKLRYGIPYIIIEHWTGYLPISFQLRSHIKRCWYRLCTRHAACVMPVSLGLAQAMQSLGMQGKYEVINNVVDDFFYAAPYSSQPKALRHMLHISCFDEPHKNIKGILRVFQRLRKDGRDIDLTIVGTGPDYDDVHAYAAQEGLNEGVQYTGMLMPEGVNEVFRKSDLFVLFSNTENAPVVISESLAVGCPILSSDVGGIREMVHADCGRMVPAGDEEALYHAWTDMLNHPEQYVPEKIRLYGKAYSYDAVGKKMMVIYEHVTKHT